MKKLIGIVAALAVFFAQQACSEGDDPAPGIRLSTETLDFPAGKSTLDWWFPARSNGASESVPSGATCWARMS